MLRGIYSAVSKLVVAADAADGEDEPSPLAFPSAKEETGAGSYPSEYTFDDASEQSPVDPNNLKTVQGKITQLLSSGYGLIDDHIVFTYDVVVGKERPRVGTMVQVEAERDHAEGGWKAKKVSIVLDWNLDPTKEDHVEIETIVGTITKIVPKTGQGFINGTIAFDQDALAHGFKPCRGDWIEAELHTDPETKEIFAKNVRPLRSRKFDGVVTTAYPGYGYIDNKIYFMFSNCENGYRPEKGDPVEGKAIESDQSKGRWRAIQVKAKKVYRRQHRATESPLQSQRMQELESNKGGIIISSNLNVGSIVINETRTIQVSVKNIGSNEHTLKSCDACSLSASISVKVYKHSTRNSPDSQPYVLPATLPPMSTRIVVLSITASQLGRTTFQVIFDFGDFQIGRPVTMTVEDPQILVLAPSPSSSPTRGKTNRRDRLKDMYNESRSSEGWVVPGRRVQRNYDPNVPVKLGRYIVPKDLEKAVLTDDDVSICYPELNQGLNVENYSIRFSTLLSLEEIQEHIDMKQFDLERVSMKPRRGEYLELDVPGLCEGRPSVMLGDKIILSSPNADKYASKYEGIVHEVLQDKVLLKFNEHFQETYQAEEYNVSFTFSRTPIRRCHQAAEFARNLGTIVLFPTKVEARPPQVNITYRLQTNTMNINLPKIPARIPRLTHQKPSQQMLSKPGRNNSMDLFNTPPKNAAKKDTKYVSPMISSGSRATNVKQAQTSDGRLMANFFNPSLNARQKAAVVRVLQGEGRPTPYIIFGPPGTGKTVTVVEAILQVHQHMPCSRVLACTPSNSAADLLAERLHLSGHVKQHEMIRLNSFRRADESIPDIIRPYCKDGEELEKIAHYRMLVCTCTTAGSFYQLGLKAGHFTHVFIDEAGQATEPECMIPAGLACGPEGQITLAGDPMQLGPVLNSEISKDYGLQLSLLERLTKRPLYRRDAKKFRDHGNYDPLLVTKLVENYRSHPKLLKLSSDIFYHGELEPRGDSKITSSLCHWEMLPNKTECPIIFHGIKGTDLREGNSPSWFNPMEVLQVIKYLTSLLSMGEPSIKTSDIGVITPYRKQVEKIRMLMPTVDIHGVKVGSVEEFQGQERLVMIISTVRSSEDQVDFDVRHHLGFVSNPKRFNVSITRAQALQIIIGNPHVLAMDRYWRALLRFCVHHGSYIGCDLPELKEEIIEEGDLDRIDEELESVQSGETPAENEMKGDSMNTSSVDTKEPIAESLSPTQKDPSYGDLVRTLNDEFQEQESGESLTNNSKSQSMQDEISNKLQNKKAEEQAIPVVEDIVQSTICSVDMASISSSVQCQNVTEITSQVEESGTSSKVEESQIPPLDNTGDDSETVPSVLLSNSQKKDSTRLNSHIEPEILTKEDESQKNSAMIKEVPAICPQEKQLNSPIDSSDSGISSDQNQDTKEVVVIGHDTSFSSSSMSDESLSPPPDSQVILPSSEQSASQESSHRNQDLSNNSTLYNENVKTNHQRVQSHCGIDKSRITQTDTESQLTTIKTENAKEHIKTCNSQQNSQRDYKTKVSNSEKQNSKESKHCIQSQKGRRGKGGMHIVIPKETEADRLKRENILKTLYPHAPSSINSGGVTSTGNDTGARFQSAKSSEPSVHLSDDSGPEEFQDYTPPSKSSSDQSLDEKSQQRGWWTSGEVIRKPHHHHHGQKQNSIFKSLETRAPGRGSPYQAKDRSGSGNPGRQNNSAGHGSQIHNQDRHDRGYGSRGNHTSHNNGSHGNNDRHERGYGSRGNHTNHNDGSHGNNDRHERGYGSRGNHTNYNNDGHGNQANHNSRYQSKSTYRKPSDHSENKTYRDQHQSRYHDENEKHRDQRQYDTRYHNERKTHHQDQHQSENRYHNQSYSKDRRDHAFHQDQSHVYNRQGSSMSRHDRDRYNETPPRHDRRDRQNDTPPDYYIGLGRGRGRGRPMQMAAQWQNSDGASGGSRPYSYGRGNNAGK